MNARYDDKPPFKYLDMTVRLWPIIVSIGILSIAYYRINALEAESIENNIRHTQIDEHSKQVEIHFAKIDANYGEIIHRLERIEAKMDRK